MAQEELPATRIMWGKPPEFVETHLLSEPGWKRADTSRGNGFTRVSYQSTDGTHEGLIYTFKNDSLVAVTRLLPLEYKTQVMPQSDWVSIGLNEWTINKENVWIKRYYDGPYIKDVFRRIFN